MDRQAWKSERQHPEIGIVNAPTLLDEAFGKPQQTLPTQAEITANVKSELRFEAAYDWTQGKTGSWQSSQQDNLSLLSLHDGASSRQINEAVAVEFGLNPDSSQAKIRQTGQKLMSEESAVSMDLSPTATYAEISSRRAAMGAFNSTNAINSGSNADALNLPNGAAETRFRSEVAKNFGLNPNASIRDIENAHNKIQADGFLGTVGLSGSKPADVQHIEDIYNQYLEAKQTDQPLDVVTNLTASEIAMRKSDVQGDPEPDGNIQRNLAFVDDLSKLAGSAKGRIAIDKMIHPLPDGSYNVVFPGASEPFNVSQSEEQGQTNASLWANVIGAGYKKYETAQPDSAAKPERVLGI